MVPSGDVWAVRADGPAKGRGKLVALVIGAAVLVAAVTGGIAHFTESGTPPVVIHSPAEANSKLYAAAVASGSFHYVDRSTAAGGGQGITSTQHGDAGRNEGVQYMNSTAGNYEVIVVDSMAYMKADAVALQNLLGLTPPVAASLSDRWISFTPSDAPYEATAADVTTATTWNEPSTSMTDQLPQTPVSVSDLFTQNGTSVQSVTYSLRGSDGTAGTSYSGRETATFAATDPHLPSTVAERLTGVADHQTTTATANVTFSQWGESVSVKAPMGSIPYSSLPQPTTIA
jgi:hypothetical protein